MLRHPDVQIWTFNYADSVDVTLWDDQEQIHFSFYEWQEDCIINTQLDNLEQMCWLIMNKTARPTARPETDDEDINYESKHQIDDNGLQS